MYIQVILPLKLSFEPFYEAPSGISVGDYVQVTLSGRRYIAVVSSAGDAPGKAMSVKTVDSTLKNDIPSESASTIAFWRTMASYYMCTIGEVFKCARPSGRLEDILSVSRKKQKEASDFCFKRQVMMSKLVDKVFALEMRATVKEKQLEKARTDASREKYAEGLRKIRKSIRDIRKEIDSLKDTREDVREGSLALELREFAGSEAASLKPYLAPGKPAFWCGSSYESRVATYAELANGMLSEGKSSLILLPETSRTLRMQEDLKEYIPEVLLLNAGNTQARERTILERMRDGRPYVLVGTRSAILLPHNDLGLVIVDDEHDASYKQDSPAPRYNARDMAVLLADGSVPVLLASRCPSMETLLNVRTGKYRAVHGDPADGRCLVVDTDAERRKRGMADILSRKLLKEMSEAVSKGLRCILMVSRKAYSPFVRCPECKELKMCPDCGGYLSVEDTPEGRVLCCRQCGRSIPYTGVCSKCGTGLKPAGAGLGRCGEIVRSFYPDLRVAEIDGDMSKKDQDAVLKAFSEGSVDILVGTQVVRKAFSCTRIGCIGVLEADRWLSGDDFRADEKALQLFRRLQGMTAPGGILVLQTRSSGHPVFVEMDNETYREEAPARGLPDSILEERRIAGYPPFTRSVDIRIDDANPKRLSYLGGMLRYAVDGVLPEDAWVFGPFPRIGAAEEGRNHIQVFLKKTAGMKAVKESLLDAIEKFSEEKKYKGHISIDVDPA